MHKYDLFICHSFEDKDQFVRPLCDRLRNLNYRVWYDEFTLKIGDSLRRSIDRGLRESQFGVVVLSPSFFGKNWPKYELDALVSRENDSGDKIILPIWHGVGKSDVMAYSATLADRVSANSAEGIDGVVRKIADVLIASQGPVSSDKPENQISDVDSLILELFEAYPGDRAAAARTLGMRGAEAQKAITALRTRLHDPSGHVRDAARWALMKIAPSELGEDEKYSTLADELAEFKHKFRSSDLDNYFDVLISGEDLLLEVIGKDRYNDLHANVALIISHIAQAGLAKNNGDLTAETSNRDMANSVLMTLKKRVDGIRLRQSRRK